MQTVIPCEFVQKPNQSSSVVRREAKNPLFTISATDMVGLSWLFVEDELKVMNSLHNLQRDMEIAWYWAMSRYQQSLRPERRDVLTIN